MHTFLAVEPCDYEIRGLYRFATLKDTGLAEALADVWPDQPRLLMVAADPADATTTENLALDLASALTKAGREACWSRTPPSMPPRFSPAPRWWCSPTATTRSAPLSTLTLTWPTVWQLPTRTSCSSP